MWNILYTLCNRFTHSISFRWFTPILVRIDIGEHILVQGWRWKGKEIYVTIGWLETSWHWTGIYVTQTHIRSIQSRWPKCIQGLQAIGIIMRECWRCWLMESIILTSWCLSRKGSTDQQRRRRKYFQCISTFLHAIFTISIVKDEEKQSEERKGRRGRRRRNVAWKIHYYPNSTPIWLFSKKSITIFILIWI